MGQFFRLASINILANLLVPLAGLIDTAFLGHLAEIRHLAGVALATVLFNYLYWTFGFLRMGTTGMTAQAIGRGDRDAAILIGLRHGIVALILGLIIVLLQVPLRDIGFTLLQATPAVKAAGQSFYNALIWGAPATLINFVLIGWFLGRAQSDRVLLITAVSSGVNILLDYEFIVHLGWQSTGAGAATAASQYLTLLVGIGLAGWELRSEAIHALTSQLLDLGALGTIVTLNRDILIRTFALITTFALFTNLSSLLGTVTLATNAILLQIVTLAAYFIDGLAFATESLAGVYQAQNARQELTQLLRLGVRASVALGLAFALSFNLLAGPLFGLLTPDSSVRSQLQTFVPWLLPVLGFGAIAFLLDGYFLGLTAGQVLRQSTVLSAGIGFAPAALVAWLTHNNHVLWLALAGFMTVRAITLALAVQRSQPRDPEAHQAG
ncbi:MATE family efflux transporter [Leptolyngbya sp. 'hensonii']|uniref:MATE family efflux transporter n=1 Tax=Leptolyngbya sp. 'hensonii' TaxID=1922337 RepID=UPI000AE2DC4A|nr:MATE family efflux transporter [Leptolyngbya sp. 'hensonii']